jgi:hypothetical protein
MILKKSKSGTKLVDIVQPHASSSVDEQRNDQGEIPLPLLIRTVKTFLLTENVLEETSLFNTSASPNRPDSVLSPSPTVTRERREDIFGIDVVDVKSSRAIAGALHIRILRGISRSVAFTRLVVRAGPTLVVAFATRKQVEKILGVGDRKRPIRGRPTLAICALAIWLIECSVGVDGACRRWFVAWIG